MQIVGEPRPANPQDVVDTELRGAWVVDVRRHPRSAVRNGWLIEWEDDIVFLTDLPEAPATWPPEAA
jgi:hypothetical protein